MAGTPAPPDRDAAVTAAEVLIGAAILGVAVLAEVALLLAHARAYSTPRALGLSAAVLLVVAAVAWRRRPAVVLAGRQLLAVAGIGALTAVLVLPGFPIGMAGWDPGIYTNHAFAIARTGAYDVEDPVLGAWPPVPVRPPGLNARFPGTAFSPSHRDHVVVDFYHLYPALLAPASDVGRSRAVVTVNPLLGILATAALALVGWRAFGPAAGTVAGVLAAVNLVQVWHARYPTTEMLSQLLLLGALLGSAVAWRTRWRPAAGLAGACTGLVFLARADGLLLVVLAAAAVAVLVAAGRADARVAWYAAGLGLTLPHGALQAYDLARGYSASQGVPGRATLAAVLLLLAAAAATARLLPVARRAVARAVAELATARARRRVGIGILVAFTLVVAAGYARPLVESADPDRSGAVSAYYNARAMLRLTWFLTPLGVAAVWAGVAVVALQRWTFARVVAVLPALLLLPVYLVDPRIGPRLIWWTRRFVPFVLPGLLLLAAVGLAAGLCWAGRGRRWVRPAAGVATVALVWWTAGMSWALREHAELVGTFPIHGQAVEAAGDDDVVWLWSLAPGLPGTESSGTGFASTMLLRRGDPVALLPADAGPEVVDAFAAAFPDRSLLVVADGRRPPPALRGVGLDHLRTIDVRTPILEITYDRKPERRRFLRWAFTIWRVEPATPGSGAGEAGR